MNAWEWYLDAWRNFGNFEGRSSRPAFWYFCLVSLIVVFMCGFLDVALGVPVLTALYGLVTLIPGLSLSVRRLHDTGYSGWVLLIGVVPYVGVVLLLLRMLKAGGPYPNRYGPNPKKDLADRTHQAVASAPASYRDAVQIDEFDTLFEMATNESSQPPPEMKLCPYCAEQIKSTAIKCKHCGEFLTDKPNEGADDE